MTVDAETVRIVRAGDALASCLREVTSIGQSRRLAPEWMEVAQRLSAEWCEATRGEASSE